MRRVDGVSMWRSRGCAFELRGEVQVVRDLKGRLVSVAVFEGRRTGEAVLAGFYSESQHLQTFVSIAPAPLDKYMAVMQKAMDQGSAAEVNLERYLNYLELAEDGWPTYSEKSPKGEGGGEEYWIEALVDPSRFLEEIRACGGP